MEVKTDFKYFRYCKTCRCMTPHKIISAFVYQCENYKSKKH